MRENAENASSLTNRTAAKGTKSVGLRRIAALALIVGAFFSGTSSQTTTLAQVGRTAQNAASAQVGRTLQRTASAQTGQTAQSAEDGENATVGANEESGTVEENGAGPPPAEPVRDAVEGAIAFLRQKQRPTGEWDEYPGYKPGTTAL
jgi:hypothetical protein